MPASPVKVLGTLDRRRVSTLLYQSSIPEPNSGCLIWLGDTIKGYGVLRWEGRRFYASRVAYFVAFNNDPGRMHVCHRCDTPSCINPAHLFLGDNSVNTADRHAKGRDARGASSGRHTKPNRTARGDRNGARTKPERLARGERNGSAKLTEEQAIAIYEADGRQVDIAAKFGVNQTTVSAIKRGQRWRLVTAVAK